MLLLNQGITGRHAHTLTHPVVVVEPPRGYGYPPPVVVPWRRLKAQGVAPEVLDALDEAHTRWAQDEAAAVRARRDAEQAAALKRAQSDAERYRRSVPYADPFWPYGSFHFGYPYRHPHLAPYGGFGWGIQIRP